ncbi:MAG: 4Fe-4S binding protein [Bacteroidales bacterium]|nr:4Fe-4S binding protein [Bacteroidales bacterium]
MEENSQGKRVDRRVFLHTGVQLAFVAGLGGLTVLVARRAGGEGYVWQLDPAKCTQCGRCATSCVKTPSAVKCVHVYAMCGYCDLCGGYFVPDTKILDTAAEHQLCPTKAIKRTFIEDPFFQYTIDEDLCIGCGKCVKGCHAFGNGSLQLQVRQNLCDNCNECAVARNCPSGAYTRVPADKPYLLNEPGTGNGPPQKTEV